MQSTMIDSASTNSEPDWLDRAAYPFQHQYLELPEGRIHYVDEGQGEPVVFVHGTPTWSFEFRHLIRAVRGTHRAIALDHFGFGLSDRPEAFPYTPEAHAEVFAEFVERLGLTRFALVVHDIGGPIALPVALERPERISRLVVMNSFMWPLDADKELAKNARFAASELGRMLYRHVNASLRIVMPNAYFDRQKLTAEIHRQYTSVFPDGEARERVLWQLARDLLDSGDHYARLWQRREALRGFRRCSSGGCKITPLRPITCAAGSAPCPTPRPSTLATRGTGRTRNNRRSSRRRCSGSSRAQRSARLTV